MRCGEIDTDGGATVERHESLSGAAPQAPQRGDEHTGSAHCRRGATAFDRRRDELGEATRDVRDEGEEAAEQAHAQRSPEAGVWSMLKAAQAPAAGCLCLNSASRISTGINLSASRASA